MTEKTVMESDRNAEREESIVYHNGEFLRYADLHLGLMTHALHYGTGCFEGIRAYWNAKQEQLHLLQAQKHYERMEESAKILQMRLPNSAEELVDITLELLRRNNWRTDTYIRPLLYISSQEVGVRLHNLETSFGIYTAPMGDYIPTGQGVKCMVSSWRRVSDTALPARGKITGSYVQAALAKSEAVLSGFDEAIVLTQEGHVAEGSAENLFMYKDGLWSTPPVTDDILEGVTRELVMGLIADELGKKVVERSIDRSELYTCEELLLCGTGAQISPVIEVDRRMVGNGQVGEMTQELQSIYFDAVRGEMSKYRSWTLAVY